MPRLRMLGVDRSHQALGRSMLFGLILGIALVELSLAPEMVLGADAKKSPNVVLILADDLGYSDLACYGSDLHETPNLDRLARQGTRFTSAYSASPVCSPTRASILTGKAPARLRMTIWLEASNSPPKDRRLIPPITLSNLPHSEETLAEILQRNGYATAHVGKWHLGDAAFYPESQGFDVNIGGTMWGAPPTYFSPYRGAFGASKEFRFVPGLPWSKPMEYLTDRLTDEALATIERMKDRPFFLHLAHHAVHTPIEGKAAMVEHYQAKLKTGMRHSNPPYAAMLQSLDESVGRVVAKLDELKLAENTLLIFASDNGGYVSPYRGGTVTNNAPLRSGKGSLYEGGIRTPLIIRWPGANRAAAEWAAPVISTDLFWTVLEITGSAPEKQPISKDGLSLAPLRKSPTVDLGRDALYFHYPHYYSTTAPASAIRTGDWKLLEYFEDNRVELYNLRDDLGELKDLASKMPDRAGEMLNRLREWRKSVRAPMAAPNPNWPVASSKQKEGAPPN